ncbi:MAG: isochorismate synthase [Actinomycetota bacterium]
MNQGPLIACVQDARGCIWVRDGEGLVGWGCAARFEPGPGEDRFERADTFARDVLASLPPADEGGWGTGPVAMGSFTFDPDVDGSVVIVPDVMLARRGGRSWLTAVGPRPAAHLDPVHPRPPDRVRYAGTTQSELSWIDAVASAVDRIGRRELHKVVLARDVVVWSEEALDARALALRLAHRFPSCFTFHCEGLIGATPELLVRRRGDAVESLVLAGTARRGADRMEDDALGAALLASEKDVSEHRMAVASIETRLDEVCERVSVQERPALLKLENVQHLATQIRGRLSAPLSSLRLAGLLHPSAAVCGTPTGAALGAIRSLEDMSRDRYAGPVGWMDARGDGEWGIALRCALLDGTQARLFAGAGIVRGSLPEAELEETRLKLRAMQSAFGDGAR